MNKPLSTSTTSTTTTATLKVGLFSIKQNSVFYPLEVDPFSSFSLFYDSFLHLQSVKNNGETEIETTPERRPSDGVDGNNKNSPIKSSLVSEQGKVERHPDIMDLAGMDYSLAKRKSPIHN